MTDRPPPNPSPGRVPEKRQSSSDWPMVVFFIALMLFVLVLVLIIRIT